MIGLNISTAAQPAFELIREVEGLSPAEYHDLSRQAEQSLGRGDYAKAAEILDKVLKAYPLEGLKWRRLGFSLYQAGKFQEAIPAFKKGNDLGHPLGRIVTGYYIAASYARAGDKDNALEWLNTIIYRYHYAGKKFLLDDPAFESLKNDARFLKLFNLPKREFSRNEGWRYDLDFLLSEIKRLNPVYRNSPLPPDLTKAASKLRKDIPKLSNAETYFEMEHLLSLLKHAHNGLLPSLAGDMVGLKQLPVTFYAFPEGLFIIDAAPPYEDLIGAKVLSFDKTPAERALDATGYLLSRENDMEILWRGPGLLSIPQALHALKLTASPETMALTILDRDGKARMVAPKPTPIKNGSKLVSPRLLGISAPPLYLSQPGDPYWFKHLKDDETVYFQFNQVTNKNNGESLARFSLNLREYIKSNDVQNLIVDVRRNNGGLTDLYVELLRTLLEFDIHHPKRLYVIIGRSTFSATGNFITDLSRLSGAVFVGEPSGAKPLLVGGDEAPITLPYSGAMGNLSSSTWALTNPHDSRLWISPDIPIQLTAKDYFANRDTVLETLLPIIRKENGRLKTN